MKNISVVGAGFGGLAAAIRLAQAGNTVQLFEACPDPGGRARAFHWDGYHFDAGPTVITAPYLFEELFQLCGENMADHVEMLPLTNEWYRFQFADGQTCDYGEKHFFEAQIREHFPAEIDGYRRLYRHAEALFSLGYEGLASAPFHQLTTMLRQLPAILKLKGYRSVYGLISDYIRDEKLRQILCTPPLLLGGNPKRASAIYFLIHILEQRFGVHYAKGGTTSLVKALENLANRQGVTIRYGEAVEGFSFTNRSIDALRTKSGQITTDAVIFNGDPTALYQSLIPAHHQSLRTRLRTARQHPSMGLVVVYFATNRRYDHLAHHIIGFSASYDRILSDVFQHNHLPDDLSFYLHRPTATDPNAAPLGQDSFYVLAPVPNLKNRQWTDDDYAEFSRHILRTLEQRLIPELSQHLLFHHSIDPRYFRDTLRSAYGAGFSLQPTLTQSAWFRFHNADPRIDNLFLCGAGTHPGAGVPGVLNSAKIVERLIYG